MTDTMDDDLLAGIAAYDAEDYATAQKLLLPLARAGNPRAQCYVASMFQGGLGYTVDGTEAVQWYQKATTAQDTDKKTAGLAYHNLGTIYSVGLPGVPQDLSVAKQCWKKAAELGSDLVPKSWYD